MTIQKYLTEKLLLVQRKLVVQFRGTSLALVNIEYGDTFQQLSQL